MNHSELSTLDTDVRVATGDFFFDVHSNLSKYVQALLVDKQPTRLDIHNFRCNYQVVQTIDAKLILSINMMNN